MRILMMACSPTGYGLLQNIKRAWLDRHPSDELLLRVKTSQTVEAPAEELISGSMKDCVGGYFNRVDAILFVSATGIAVRCIAPFLVHKSVDPAVVVMDETGKFSISLLSGHTGGANALAEELAAVTGAVPVVTTATDREGKPAIDVWAKKNRMEITNWEQAKRVSAEILNGKELVYYLFTDKCDMPISDQRVRCGDTLPVVKQDKNELPIGISPYRMEKEVQQRAALWLVPKWIHVGIGCRKDTPKERVETAVRRACEEAGICFSALAGAASIDLKKEEAGLKAFCAEHDLPFETFSAEELRSVSGTFTASDFVASVTGVDNVCERSAVCASRGGQLIFAKHAYEGVTVAFAMKTEELRFE